MPPKATPPNPPEPPAAPAPAAEPAQPTESHAEKLHRALSVEVETLRQQLAQVPDSEALAALQQKASKFDQLSQQLPAWEQQLQQLHRQEVATLQAQHQQSQQELAAARLDAAAAAAFGQAQGRTELWQEFRAMVGGRLTAAPDGSPLLDGEPLGKRFKAQVDADPHGALAIFARPQFGSGSGSRSARDGRAVPGQKLSLASGKEALLRAGFGGGAA
jgi:hypothetical protein